MDKDENLQQPSTFSVEDFSLQGTVYWREYFEVEDTWRLSSLKSVKYRKYLESKALHYCKHETQELKDIPFWVWKAVIMRTKGQKPILFVDNFSQNTLKYAGIFSAVCVSFDARHKQVDVEIAKDYKNPLDLWLKQRIGMLKTPIFLKLQTKENNLSTLVKQNNGKSVRLEHTVPQLEVSFEGGENFSFELKTLIF